MTEFLGLLGRYLRVGVFSIPVGICYAAWTVNRGESYAAITFALLVGVPFSCWMERLYQSRMKEGKPCARQRINPHSHVEDRAT